ncbi:MAG: hypothetical protein P0116_01995 [Candidatus Nitrosocosmicus sp.]|nr:hypothetical protein [Candidatus Nitrosocosmicus sp.]
MHCENYVINEILTWQVYSIYGKCNPIPTGYDLIISHIFENDSAAVIEFYAKVFGGVEEYCHSIPGNKNKENKGDCSIGNNHWNL